MIPHQINQLAGDTAASNNSYTGPARELIVDTDGWTMRLHDAATQGGKVFAPLNVTDLRYQAKNAFMDALSGLSGLPGFIFVGPSGVGTRSFAFDAQDFVVDAGVLVTDDYMVSLSATIDGARTFTGNVTFASGLSGALTGSLAGNSAGVHTGDVTGNVTGDLTGDSTGAHVGDVDVRGASLQLDAHQIPDAALSVAMQALLTQIIAVTPLWSIVIWDSARTVPDGWQECDGTNGTIDMRGRFPVGALSSDSDFLAGLTGGAKTHTHGTVTSAAGGAHGHAITVDNHTLTIAEIPAHTHTNVLGNSDSNGGLTANGSSSGPSAATSSIGGGGAHNHTGSAAAATDHTHGVTVPSLQSLPPYRAIRFIQRIS